MAAANKLQVALRRRRVANFFVRGYSDCAEIADALEEDMRVISRDVAAIKEQWRTSAVEDWGYYVNQMDAKIAHLEREAWQEWEESRKEKTVKTTEREMEGGDEGGAGKIASQRLELKSEKRCGDPRYLEVVQWCLAQRAKLYGLDVLKVAPTTPDGQEPYQLAVGELTRESIMQVVEAARRQFGGLDPRMRIAATENN